MGRRIRRDIGTWGPHFLIVLRHPSRTGRTWGRGKRLYRLGTSGGLPPLRYEHSRRIVSRVLGDVFLEENGGLQHGRKLRLRISQKANRGPVEYRDCICGIITRLGRPDRANRFQMGAIELWNFNRSSHAQNAATNQSRRCQPMPASSSMTVKVVASA